MCDISDGSYSFAKKLTDEVSDLHVTEIDALLITHYHNKHIQLISRVSDNEILRSIFFHSLNPPILYVSPSLPSWKMRSMARA